MSSRKHLEALRLHNIAPFKEKSRQSNNGGNPLTTQRCVRFVGQRIKLQASCFSVKHITIRPYQTGRSYLKGGRGEGWGAISSWKVAPLIAKPTVTVNCILVFTVPETELIISTSVIVEIIFKSLSQFSRKIKPLRRWIPFTGFSFLESVCYWNDGHGFDSWVKPKTRKISMHSFPAWRSAIKGTVWTLLRVW